MAKTGRQRWVSILTYALIILIVGVLIWLVTWTPSPAVTPQVVATVENRTVQETVEVSGVIITQSIDDNEQKVIQLYVDEYAVVDLEIDQSVDLALAALDYEGVGKVHSIADQPRLTGDTTEYEVIVQFDEVPDDVRNGMHVDVTVVLASIDSVLAVPNESVYTVQDDYFVDRVTEERRVELPRLGITQAEVATEPVAVDIGLEGDDYTEITSGLDTSDKVVVH